MSHAKRLWLVGGGAVVLVAIFFHFGLTEEREKVQPLAYNHKLHVGEVGLGCIDCHTRYESSARATIPPLETCEQCHSGDALTDSPEERRLLDEYVAKNAEIPWQRVYSVPDHVLFSHRRHVIAGKIECKECHGDVREMTLPVSVPAKEVSMERCMSCHRDRLVTNDCLSCHR